MIDVTYPPFNCVGDGVTQEGAKLVAALTCGDDLYFPRGKTFLMDGVTLCPSGGQKLVIGGKLRKAISVPGYTNSFIRIAGVDGVTVEGGAFECINSAREYAITTQDAKDTTISRVKCFGATIFLYRGSQRTRITDAYLKGGQQGIATGGDAAGNTNGLVLDTWIVRPFIEGMDNEGIDINWDTQRCWITDANLRGNALVDPATEFDFGGGLCSDIYVTGSRIDGLNHSVRGFMVKHQTNHSEFTGNTVLNCQRGFELWNVDHILAVNNNFSRCATPIFQTGPITNCVTTPNMVT